MVIHIAAHGLINIFLRLNYKKVKKIMNPLIHQMSYYKWKLEQMKCSQDMQKCTMTETFILQYTFLTLHKASEVVGL